MATNIVTRGASLLRAALLVTTAIVPFAISEASARVGVTSGADGDPLGKPPDEAERVLRIGIDVQANEIITTGAKDRAHLVFLDGSALTVGSDARLVIDNFVYDPNTKKGELAINASKGVFRLVGGKISKAAPINITTPSSTIGIRGVECNDVRHGAHPGALGPVTQISVEVVLELVEIDDGAPLRLVAGRTFRIKVEDGGVGAGAAHPADRRHIGAHQRGPGGLQRRDHIAHHRGGARRQRTIIHVVGRIFRIARNADAGAAQAILVEDARIVGRTLKIARRLIQRIGGRQHIEEDRGIAHRAGERACGVLGVGDRDDAGAADEPDRRLHGDDTVLGGGRKERARCLGADRNRREPGRDRDRRARTRPAGLHDRNASGVEFERKRIFDLAAERRIARRHIDRQDIGELGEVRFAEDHRAGLAQELRHRRVAIGVGVRKRQRAGGGVLGVAGCDIVLEENRDSLQRPPRAGFAGVDRCRNCRRIRVHLAHRVEARAGAIIGFDPRHVGAHQIGRRGAAGGKRALQIVDRRVLRTHGSVRGYGRRCGGRGRQGKQHH